MRRNKEFVAKLLERASFPSKSENSVRDLLGNKKIILYGAGSGNITFSSFVLNRFGLKPFLVLDKKFKYGDRYLGIPAVSPREYKPTEEEKEQAVVVVTVGKNEYYKEIFASLAKLQMKNVILANDVYEYHVPQLPTELASKGFEYYLDRKEQILACPDIFADDLSLEVYTRFLQNHLLRKPIKIPSRSMDELYFPADIKLNKGYARFINCGAYNGDSVKRLNALLGKIEALACFEPDLENYRLLTKYLSSMPDEIAQCILSFPCGVFSNDTQLHFETGNQVNSTISDKGASFIQCVMLDHALPGFNPTFINMNIEGAELDALMGAEQTIRKNKPDLAICVYHSPSHVWEIPLFLKSLQLGYKFYLRNYSSFPTETVLYATI
ncbi:MAG: FkbM family methyltransferase [Candidatus Margulisiibacteriota bacterium]